MPLFSIIIPTYNRKDTLPRAIDSVIKQVDGDFEIIIIDDASTDGTKEYIAKHYPDRRLRYILMPENVGVHGARNAGIAAATGEWLCFLDSDDEFYPNALSAVRSVIQENPGVGFVSAPFMTDTGQLTGYDFSTSQFIPYPDLLALTNTRGHKTGLLAIKKTIIAQHRFKAPNVDFIFYRYISRAAGGMWYIAEPLGVYHISLTSGSMTAKRKKPNPALSVIRARALADFLDDFELDLIACIPKRFAAYAYGAVIGLLLDGQKQRARKLAVKAWRIHRARPRYIGALILVYLPGSALLLHLLFRLKKILAS